MNISQTNYSYLKKMKTLILLCLFAVTMRRKQLPKTKKDQRLGLCRKPVTASRQLPKEFSDVPPARDLAAD